MKPNVGAKIIQSYHPLARLKAISGLKWFHLVFGNDSFEHFLLD